MGRKAGSRKRPQLRMQMAWRKDTRKEIFDLAMLFTQTKVIEALEYGKRPRSFRRGTLPPLCSASAADGSKVMGVSPQTIVTVSLPLE